ncbi:putative transposase [Halalkalicoccus paucihalophilus]|uniref:Putative transposase n=1 Tax=Halalkalicoccus paucihalophilus TaxID=1008153 RepID=A0A151AAA7_9EURY|nr:RNA-guided endonuclease TnpB family protein [Halalkalicoccus paucihalophilus]KYH24432.1 putative transposase [Halalkalicoccus paucihalophilus]
MDLTLRFRAYPDDDTESEAWRHINIHRQIRNHAVRDYYRAPRSDRPSAYDQHRKLTEWKRQWSMFADVSAHAAQQTVSQIHKDLKVLKEHRKNGRKTGRLKWQGSGEVRSVAYQSEGFNVNHTTGQDDDFGTLTLSKIGEIPIRAHRDLPETENVKRAVLKKERTGDWFACFVVEVEPPEKPDPDEIDPTDCIGVDLGIQSYIHTSDDLSVECLDLADEYDHYAKEQRSLDRKQRGSANWENQRRKVAKAKRRIRWKVLDFQHKLSTWLVREYDVVAVEDLDVKPMLETSQSAKNKQDAAWSRFLDLLEYKGDLHGTHVIRVDARGTTKECNECSVETSKPLWVREHSCPACGHTEDRDLNAAKNILDRGLNSLHVGPGRSESTPVQTVLPAFTRHSGQVDAKHVIEAGSPAA